MIRFAEGTGDFTSLKRVQIASGAQSVSHSIGAGGFSPSAKRSGYEATISSVYCRGWGCVVPHLQSACAFIWWCSM